MRSAISLFAFVAAGALGIGSPLRGDQPKSLDCLQVSVAGSDSVISHSTPPIRLRVLHLVLKNICSVDITAFALEADIKSPVAQQRRIGDDMVYRLRTTSPLYEKIPLAGKDFSYDFSVRDDPAGELPFEGTIKVTGIAFRDVTAIGESGWVTWMERTRKVDLRNFTDELALLVKVARLEDAKALLKGDPDDSLTNGVKAFWREIQGNVGNDAVKWGAYVNWRANEMQIFIGLMKSSPNCGWEIEVMLTPALLEPGPARISVRIAGLRVELTTHPAIASHAGRYAAPGNIARKLINSPKTIQKL